MTTPVMVVDDDPDVRDTVKTILEFKGMQVLAVESGKACLEELGKGFKGLVLLDIMMPVMDGWSVVKAMLEAGYTEGILVCMLTAVEPDPVLAEYSRLVLGYIRKPFDSRELVETVREHLSLLP